MALDHIVIDKQILALDKHGYLADISNWQPAVAEQFAVLEGINLTPAHWEVIDFVRAFYQQHASSPAMRVLVKAMAQQLGADKGNSMYLFSLFPQGPAKQATRLAGLPKPARCL